MDQERLAQWLIEQCVDRNLSWAEASRRAGVSPNTISQIVSGINPGIKRLTALADFFGVSPDFLFRLAGILPPNVEPGAATMEAFSTLFDIYTQLQQRSPAHAQRLKELVLLQAEALATALGVTPEPDKEKVA